MKCTLQQWKMAVSLFMVMALVFSLNAQCDQHKALIEKMDKALAEKNVELLAEVYKADAKRHTSDGETLNGLEAIQKQSKEFYTNVPDAASTNEDIICQGDRIVIRWNGTGTVKDAGKSVKVSGITIYQIKDGKIAEEWEEMSNLSLMMQLGYELKAPGGGK